MLKIKTLKKAFEKSMDFINAYIVAIVVSGIISLGFAIIGGIVALVLENANEALVFGKLIFSIIIGGCLGLSAVISLAIAINNDNVSVKSIFTGHYTI